MKRVHDLDKEYKQRWIILKSQTILTSQTKELLNLTLKQNPSNIRQHNKKYCFNVITDNYYREQTLIIPQGSAIYELHAVWSDYTKRESHEKPHTWQRFTYKIYSWAKCFQKPGLNLIMNAVHKHNRILQKYHVILIGLSTVAPQTQDQYFVPICHCTTPIASQLVSHLPQN